MASSPNIPETTATLCIPSPLASTLCDDTTISTSDATFNSTTELLNEISETTVNPEAAVETETVTAIVAVESNKSSYEKEFEIIHRENKEVQQQLILLSKMVTHMDDKMDQVSLTVQFEIIN
jgi:hypothetical protein